jgi:periplasmic protein TonB
MRTFVALIIALPVTLALFLLMPSLITVSAYTGPQTHAVDLDFRFVQPPDPEDSDDAEDDPPEPPQGPVGQPVMVESLVAPQPGRPVLRSGSPDFDGSSDLDLQIGSAPQDCDHGPLAVVKPFRGYPIAAARTGTEGWVLVGFIVGTDGSVRDAAVLDAQPPGTFDRHALDSVGRWRFRPAMIACVALASRLEQRIEYTLED